MTTYIQVAHNFACPTARRELGEAHEMLKAVDARLSEVEQYLEYLRASTNADIRKSAQTLFEYLGDARADASWASLVSDANDAASVAMVRKINKGVSQ
jgi:hypothetical protein